MDETSQYSIRCYKTSDRTAIRNLCCATGFLGTPIDPVIEYPHNAGLSADCKFPDHGVGVSITGGYVYRGKKKPGLRGVYVYADYQMGTIWGLRHENGQISARGELSKANPTRPIVSFAEDRDGELYVLSFDGKIYEMLETGK